jgi:Domain of unknown function (DUF6457)
MTMQEWIDAFAQAAEVEGPSTDEVTALLELAATAAHASERTAAPLTCWIAGRSRRPLEELSAAAQRLAAG